MDGPRRRDPLARAVQLLAFMVDSSSDTYGVRQLALGLGMSASTAHRLLGDLENLGMIRKVDAGYQLGLEFHRLAWTAIARFPLPLIAKEVLEALSQSSEETAFLGVYDRQTSQVMFPISIDSPHPLRYVLKLNTWLPLHAGASGLAIMAFLPQAAIDAIISADLQRVTDLTLTDPTRLNKRLQDIRSKGYAVSRGERIAGAMGIAAPVFGPLGDVVGDVGITLPEGRTDQTDEANLVQMVVDAARAVTGRISRS